MANILVVDDAKFSRKMIVKLLEEAGHSTEEFNSGKGVIERIKEGDVDGVTLDLLMPEVSGIDVLAEYKDEALKIPIIVLSADIQDDIKKQCMALGANSFLNKPWDEKELLKTIATF